MIEYKCGGCGVPGLVFNTVEHRPKGGQKKKKRWYLGLIKTETALKKKVLVGGVKSVPQLKMRSET